MYKEFIEDIARDNFRGFNSLEYDQGAAGSGQELYVSFKTILRFIADNLNLFAGTSATNRVEVLKLDWESDKPMFIYSTSISCNLQKCYIRNAYLKTSVGTLASKTTNFVAPFAAIDSFDRTTPQGNSLENLRDTLADGYNLEGVPVMYPSIGNINNIYINIGYLNKVLLNESNNEDGKVSIQKYLQEVCNGVNKALGSINDLQVVIDQDVEPPVLTIVDYQQTRIKRLSTAVGTNSNITIIQAQGLGSMLTNISAQSSITPEVATMISVGAQAQGYVVGEEAVSFSKLSKGLTDRIYPQKTIGAVEKETPSADAQIRIDETASKFQAVLETYSKLIALQRPKDDQYGPINLTSDNQSDFENIATDLYKYMLAQFTETGQTSTGLIPIKVTLSMHGMSGIKMYQKFKLSSDVLPLSYNRAYEFIIMGVSHEVTNSKWSTTLSSTISLEDSDTSSKQSFGLPLTLGEPVYGSNCPAPGTNIISGGWDPVAKPLLITPLSYKDAKSAIQQVTSNKNLQIAILAVMIQEQGDSNVIRGFNHNYGGFDITRGAWKFNTIGASNTNGYVLAIEGVTKCKIAYVSFRDTAAYFRVKLETFIRKGFDKPLTGAQVATLWYEKWNGKGARLFWDNNDNNYKTTYPTVEEYDKFVVLNFEKTHYVTAKKIIG